MVQEWIKNLRWVHLVTKEHLAKVKSYVDIGEKEGAKLIVDGRNLKLQGYEKDITLEDVYLIT